MESLGHADSLKGKFGYQVTLSWREIDEHLDTCKTYNSLAELNEEWEDYEEPKEYWFMDYGGRIKAMNDSNDEEDVARKEIGNYFDTREEAELAVRKLKAWKRLKDKGFEFKTWGWEKRSGKEFTIWFTIDDYENSTKDLDLLFGGEE